MLRHAIALSLPMLVLAASLVGCGGYSGPDLGTVSGTVTLDGAPLAEASVQFQPEDGRPSYGTTDAGGGYELLFARDKPGAAVGKHTVKITSNTYGEDAEGNEIELPQKVPARYNADTELTADVEPGPNQIDFDLASAPDETPEPTE